MSRKHSVPGTTVGRSVASVEGRVRFGWVGNELVFVHHIDVDVVDSEVVGALGGDGMDADVLVLACDFLNVG